jgi:hypothetical protein
MIPSGTSISASTVFIFFPQPSSDSIFPFFTDEGNCCACIGRASGDTFTGVGFGLGEAMFGVARELSGRRPPDTFSCRPSIEEGDRDEEMPEGDFLLAATAGQDTAHHGTFPFVAPLHFIDLRRRT